MRILALDSAVARCSATIVVGNEVVAVRQADIDRGHATVLPVMTRDCLDAAGLDAPDIDLIAVTVGPGSFTGIRGGIALAQGIAVAADRPVVGVTIGGALAESLPQLGGRLLWVAIASRRGRVFLEINGQVLSVEVTALPNPRQPIAVAGGSAADIVSRLAARGADVMLTDARLPTGRHIAQVAERRYRGLLPPLPVEPLYVDPPQARPRPSSSGTA